MKKGIICLIISMAVVIGCSSCRTQQNKETPETTLLPTEKTLTQLEENTVPWEAAGAKQPKDYTWEEYLALTDDLQYLFYNSFEAGAFDAWLEENEPKAEGPQVPWETAGAKKPSDYTWEEYNNLSADQQAAFYNWFGSEAAFETWLQQFEDDQTGGNAPWEKAGAKQPEDYTWREYLALSEQEQSMFYNSFGSEEAFDEWMKKVNPEEQKSDAEGNTDIKLQSKYTWYEYMRLTEQEQTAFFNTFESEEAFNEWLDSVSPVQDDVCPWERPGGKQPEDYTWDEYIKLTAEQQIIFFNYLNEKGQFDIWLAANEPG